MILLSIAPFMVLKIQLSIGEDLKVFSVCFLVKGKLLRYGQNLKFYPKVNDLSNTF